MAYEKPRIISVIGQTIKFSHPEEVEGVLKTYVTADLAASGTSLTVLDNLGFADNDILRFGNYGDKKCELKDITASPTAGTSLTVAAVTFTQVSGTVVSKVLYDQFDIYGAGTEDGTKTAIASAQAIQSWSKYNSYTSSTAYNYYFIRFYNSKASTPFYSDYSDAIASAGYALNSVAGLKQAAAEEINVELSHDPTAMVNHKFLDREINLCLEDIRGKKNRWSWMQSIDYNLGNLSYGLRRIALPSDIYDNETSRSLMSVRIGTGEPLTWIPWEDYAGYMSEAAHTTVATAAASGALSLECSDTSDFGSSGSLAIGSQTSSIAYTANASNTFTITAGEITAAVSSGTDVWYNANVGSPEYFTVADGYIYFYPVCDSTWADKNIFIDYYKVVTTINSDGDIIEPIRWDAVKDYLCYVILKKKKLYDEANEYKKDYVSKVTEMIQKERSVNSYHFSPALNQISYKDSDSTWNKRD